MSDPLLANLPKWRRILWPVHSYEFKKVLPLFLMKFCFSFTYGILTAMKDASVVTARGSGAEVIPILKGWIVLPIALGTTLLFSKLSNIYRRDTLFYAIVLFFMSFLAFYGFFLHPNLEAFSPHASADWLVQILGEHNSHWIAIYRNWGPSLFFVIAELWGQVGIFLLFWGFVNRICNFNEAKRCYNLFIAGGDLAQMFAGPIVCYCTGRLFAAHFSQAVQSLILIVIIFGCLIMGLHWLLTTKILRGDPRLFCPEQEAEKLELKTKLTLLQSLKLIATSPALRAIATMVVAYGLVVNLTEVTWKANLKLAFPLPADYQSFVASVNSSVGFCSFFITLFFSGMIIRFLGWRFSAQLPPILIGATSLLFLFFFLYPQWLSSLFTISPLMIIVFAGAFQNVITKVMKYAFFDSTKEMSFIRLDTESKVKGKAAVDVIGSRLGKSGAAWIQLFLIQLAGTGSVLSITHFLVPIIVCTLVFWLLAIRSLNREFTKTAPVTT
ncbi:MAG: NTP/NDP exchange transporter [Verrucomicrobiota bacterium]|nr:NTP/NDP exchange transporter [Verrucomicrobiota bacterium]